MNDGSSYEILGDLQCVLKGTSLGIMMFHFFSYTDVAMTVTAQGFGICRITSLHSSHCCLIFISLERKRLS